MTLRLGFILAFVSFIVACTSTPPADGLRDSFAQQLASNKFVSGFERSGDNMTVMLMLDDQTYWFFQYARGQMLTYSSDANFNTMLSELKEDKMKQESKKDEPEFRFMLTGKTKVNAFRDRSGL